MLKACLNKELLSRLYFVLTRTKHVFKVYYLYKDTHLTFLKPAISNGNGWYQALLVTIEVIPTIITTLRSD
jgi:hypothetical protein